MLYVPHAFDSTAGGAELEDEDWCEGSGLVLTDEPSSSAGLHSRSTP